MEMYDLPIWAASRNYERNATIGTGRLSISYAGHCIQTRNHNGGIGQHQHRAITELGASWPISEQRLFKVLTYVLWLQHNRFASGSNKQRVGRVEPDNAVNIRIGKRRGPRLDQLECVLFRTGNCV